METTQRADYPKGDGNGSLSVASTIYHRTMTSEARYEFTGDVIHYQTINPKVTHAIRVVKEYCTMGRGAKKAEDGRQALEHTRAAVS
jgi:hypothetical protein